MKREITILCIAQKLLDRLIETGDRTRPPATGASKVYTVSACPVSARFRAAREEGHWAMSVEETSTGPSSDGGCSPDGGDLYLGEGHCSEGSGRHSFPGDDIIRGGRLNLFISVMRSEEQKK